MLFQEYGTSYLAHPPPPHPIWKQSWLRFSTRCTGHWVTQTWVKKHGSPEMIATVEATEEGGLTIDKRATITSVLRATKMNPRVFSDVAPAA